jgi:hypothetical protein
MSVQGKVAQITKDVQELGATVEEQTRMARLYQGEIHDLRVQLEAKDAELAASKAERHGLWRFIKPDIGTPVVYVGVYVTRWQPEWGEPTAGFVQAFEEA